MAKVIVTFEDDDDGKVSVRWEFDPEINLEAGETGTAAQYMALKGVDLAMRWAQQVDDED